MTPERLKNCRKVLGLTQSGLAEQIGNSVGTISCWEQGRHDVPLWAQRLIERLVADHEAATQERRAA